MVSDQDEETSAPAGAEVGNVYYLPKPRRTMGAKAAQLAKKSGRAAAAALEELAWLSVEGFRTASGEERGAAVRCCAGAADQPLGGGHSSCGDCL